MKKLTLIMVALMLSLSLFACDTENAPNDSQIVIDGSQSKLGNVQTNTNDNQDTTDNDQDSTTSAKNEAIKWAEDDYYVEENWQKTYSVYEKWAEHFKNIDTSSDGFRIYPNTKALPDESDGIFVINGPNTYNLQLSGDDSIKEELETIVVGNAWQRVHLADPNGVYPWLSASYDLVPQNSFHYSKQWIYYFEYEDLIVKKIVKISPNELTEIGEDAKEPTRNTWCEEDLQEENWQKIYQAYVKIVEYFRDDIDIKAPGFVIEREKYTMRKILDAYVEDSNIKFSIALSREHVQPLIESVKIGDYVLDVVDNDPYSSYAINENDPSLTQCSHHYFNNCAYYIEYKNGYVTKIVKITADNISVLE